tara:strand:+ start:472 stop:801 length:330 start_codon:yes stop_codon:yes gene_type:complete
VKTVAVPTLPVALKPVKVIVTSNDTDTDPTDPVKPEIEVGAVAPADTVGVPTEAVTVRPVTGANMSPAAATEPTNPVADVPVRDTLSFGIVTVPISPVAVNPEVATETA